MTPHGCKENYPFYLMVTNCLKANQIVNWVESLEGGKSAQDPPGWALSAPTSEPAPCAQDLEVNSETELLFQGIFPSLYSWCLQRGQFEGRWRALLKL